MLKRIALVVLIALPLGVFAQDLKFGHINSDEIITVMPEYSKARTDLQTLEKSYADDLQRTQEEFNRKYQEFQQAADSLPQNIAERRQRELEDMLQRQNEFRQKAMQDMEKASADLMAPIQKKLSEAIQAVGKAEGVVYIFDMARAAISYVDETKSINLTAKVKTQLGIK